MSALEKKELTTSLFLVRGTNRTEIRSITTTQHIRAAERVEMISGCNCRGLQGHHHETYVTGFNKTQLEYKGSLGGGTPRRALQIGRK